jgi:hypothetical protein
MRSDINEKIYVQLERQFARDGAPSIFKSLRTACETLRQHQDKLPTLTYRSQVEKTIRNVETQIRTIEKFIEDNNLNDDTL